MNPATFHALQRHVLACACAFAASGALAELTPELRQVAELGSEQLRTAYLECDRLSARVVLPPELMASCVAVSHVLLHRDFGGDLELQLQWWRGARDPHAAAVAAEGCAPGADTPPAGASLDQ